MFRKALLPLLCAATIAAAIPLHIGESWAWQVTNRDSLDLTYRSAVVVDSTRIPAGKVWTLVARDSVLKKSDTAKILVWPNGRQTWLRQSVYLNWELQPRDSGDTSIFVIGTDTTSIWGEASSLEPGVHNKWSQESSSRHSRFAGNGVMKICDSLPSKISKQNCDDVEVGTTFVFVDGKTVRYEFLYSMESNPAPIHVWSDTLGMERALTFYQSPRGRDWRLVSHNRRSIAPPRDDLRIPVPQTTASWVVKTTESSRSYDYKTGLGGSTYLIQHLRWKISARLPDSAGWTGIGISQSSTTCTWSTYYPQAYMSPPLEDTTDTICEPPVLDDVVVRIHPDRGQSFSNATNLPPLQISWIRPWERLGTSDSTTTLRSWDGWEGNHRKLGGSYMDVWKKGVLTGWSSYFWSNSFAGAWLVWFAGDQKPSSFELIGIYPPGTEPPSSIRSKASNITSLKDLAHTFPNTPIRWSTAAGRTGTLMASEIVQRPAALRGKTLFLQARLPDGRLWQGTHVVP